MPEVSADGFKQTLRRFASGVTIVTMKQDDDIHGITVSAFLSVSLEPPLVLVSIDKRSRSHEKLLAADRYGVSILAEDQERVSNHFAGWDHELEPKFSDLGGFPVIEGALGQIACRTVDKVDAGDHTLFVGRIEHLDWREGQPLIYHNGKYRKLTESSES